MRVASVGAGSWGTTVAALAARNGADVVLWARRPELADEVNSRHTNDAYLPGVALPPSLRATADIAECVHGRELVVMGVPSHCWRDVLRDAAPSLGAAEAVVSLTKGLERGRDLRMSQVLAEELPGLAPSRFGVLTGPNIAIEVARGLPAASVVALGDEGLAARVQAVFHQPVFRVYTNPDVTGCELAGAVKNVIAIAAGVSHAFAFGDNAMAALMTRGLAELTRIGVRLGGRAVTFAGLAGMGDLIVTCTSPHSRNRRAGTLLGGGASGGDLLADTRTVAEGVRSCPSILALADAAGAYAPITRGVVSVIYEGVTPRDMVAELLGQPMMPETFGFDP